MLFIVILAVLIAFSYEPLSDAELQAGPVLAGVLLLVCSSWLLAELLSRLIAKRLEHCFDQRESIMRSYQRLRWMHATLLLAGYGAVIHKLEWSAVVRYSWGFADWVLVDDLFVLAPFVASIVLAALAQYRVEDVARRRLESPNSIPSVSRWSHVDFLLRQQLGVVFVPLILLIAVQDILELAVPAGPVRQWAELGAGVTALAAVLILAPLFLRWLWRAEPLPQGPLRDRLERLSRQFGFRSSGILVWNTKGTVINAAVTGILPTPRYVLLSDGLLNCLTDDEVVAVFGHEVGHIRHHHLWFYVGFMQVASLFLLASVTTVSQLLAGVVGQPTADHLLSISQGLVLPTACLTLYFGVFFGFLSRRFERQADVFGCRAVSCGRPQCSLLEPHESGQHTPELCPTGIRVFIGALEKISNLNGATREMRSWRHFSVAKRVEFLERLAARPELERRFQRTVLLLKLLVIAALLASGWWVWRQSPHIVSQLLGLSQTVGAF